MIKKYLLTVLTSLLIITSISLPIFSETNYVESPNIDDEDITIVDGKDVENGGSEIEIEKNDGHVEKVIITPYEDRNNIKDEHAYNQLVEAYESIKNANNLEELVPEIKKIANDQGANTEDLGVRYLFDISVFDGEADENGIYIELNTEFENLSDFICLMEYKDGIWSIVEGVKIDPNNPNRIYIPINTNSAAYAVVVANDYNYSGDSPIIDDGDDEKKSRCYLHWIYVIIAAIFTILFIIINKEINNNKNNKYLPLIKLLLVLIDIFGNLILFNIYKACNLDIIALVANYAIVLLACILSIRDKDE